VLKLPSQAESAGAGRSQSQVVTLVRLEGAGGECGKEEHLGGDAPRTLHIGRHEDNQIVLSGRAFSKCHLQVSLRTFRLNQDEPEMEAAFLKDQSSNGTLVNGSKATKPWHWLQHGDRIGFFDRRRGEGGPNHSDFFEVQYSSRQTVPREAFDSESDPEDQPLAAAAAAKKRVVQKSPRPEPEQPEQPEQPEEAQQAVSEPAVDAAAGSEPAAVDAAAGSEPAKGPWRIPKCPMTFGAEIMGAVLDVFYEEEKQTFRVKIDKFMKEDNFHHVDSTGYSEWDGESFDDTLDVNDMYPKGFIKFVDKTTLARIKGAEAAAALKEAQPRKRLRKTD